MRVPAAVKLVLEAVCILLGGKSTRKKDPVSGNMVDDYTPAVKAMLQEDLYRRIMCVAEAPLLLHSQVSIKVK